MNEYLFLYRSEPMTDTPSPDQMQATMQKWGAWIKSLADGGHITNVGHPLGDEGKVAGSTGVTDGPYAEAKDLVNGFTVIRAKNLDDAAALSAGCPIFDGGGFVEVRPVIQMNM